MKIIFAVLIYAFNFYASGELKPEVKMKTPHETHSIIEFKKLISPELTAKKTREVFGDPDKDVGSGLYIYVYPIKEGGKLTLSFDSKLRSAHYQDEVLFSRAANSTGAEQTLLLHKSIKLSDISISLESIEKPGENLPGNRAFYHLSLMMNSKPEKKVIRFDPFNSDQEFSFGAARFKIQSNPSDVDSVIIKSSKLKD